MSTQQEPDEYRDCFVFDANDETYCLDIWFTEENKARIEDFCQRFGLNPHDLIEYGIRAVIDASNNPQGAIFLYGLPAIN